MREGLSKFLPPGTVDLVCPFLEQHKVHLTVTRQRATKHGDYQPPMRYPTHRISVNGNLNPYMFLVTLVHEMAHLAVWVENRSLKNPHGVLWKKTYAEMMAPFFENEIFPDDIRAALLQHMQNPKATTGSDTELATALRRHDAIQVLTVDDIPEGDVFILDGRSFRKGQKLRTHYLCECLAGKGKYRVRGTAKITTSRSL